MMRKLNFWNIIIIIALALPVIVACGSDDDSEGNSSSSDNSAYDKELESQLKGTSWKIKRNYSEYNDGNIKEWGGSDTRIMTLDNDNSLYIINGSSTQYYGEWTVENRKIEVSKLHSTTTDANPGSIRSQLVASGWFGRTIERLTDSEMITRWELDDYDSVVELTRVSYVEGTKNDDTGGSGGGTSGDAPYVTSFDFTATKSSITVNFMVSERPTRATVKYGTSSATSTISSSISGKQVSATATGLKAGTKYYFKCTVQNQYGSSTSDTFSAMTNY